MTKCRDCDAPTRGPRMRLCQSCKDAAVERNRIKDNGSKGLVTGICHMCDGPAPGTRSFYCSDECRRVARRAVSRRYRSRIQRKRKDKVRELLVAANRMIVKMLREKRLEANTIRAIGNALAAVHVDAEDRWKTMAPRSEKKAA